MSEAARDRYVYAINDELGVPCYIGAGKGNRLNHHILAAQGKRKPPNAESAKHLYFVNCIKRGYMPVAYKVAEDLTIEQAMAYERMLIAWYGRRDLGTGCLFNTCDGGFGIKNYSAKTKALISQRTREAMSAPEFRDNLSKKAKAKFARPGARERVSKNTLNQFATKGHPRKGKRNTPESCARIAAATKEAMARPDIRAKTIAGLCKALAKTEVRANISKSQKKRWTPELKAAQAERMHRQQAAPGGKDKLYASRRKQNSSEVGMPA